LQNSAIIGKSRNKNKGLILSVGPHFLVNRPAIRSKTRDLEKLVPELVTMDENTIEATSRSLLQEAQTQTKAKEEAAEARMDAKFQ